MGRLFAVLAAIAIAPFHLAIAAAIFFGDRGPVFYRSMRLGKDGRPFEMYKYRSMKVGCEARIDDGFKTVVGLNDPRVTAAGRILRCGLDEIPQLLNVVAQGHVDPGVVFTHDLPLSEAARGYDVMNGREEGSIKVALTP